MTYKLNQTGRNNVGALFNKIVIHAAKILENLPELSSCSVQELILQYWTEQLGWKSVNALSDCTTAGDSAFATDYFDFSIQLVFNPFETMLVDQKQWEALCDESDDVGWSPRLSLFPELPKDTVDDLVLEEKSGLANVLFTTTTSKQIAPVVELVIVYIPKEDELEDT